ncbi:hypothetical protein ACI2LF_05235 [Kribbella sp. NPDC020789]
MCGKLEVGCQIKEGLVSAATSGLESIAKEVSQAALDSMHAAATFWIKTPTATIASGSGSHWTDSGPVDFLHDNTLTVTAAVFTLAILIAGIRTAWEQRAKPLQELLKSMMVFVLVCGAGSAVLQNLAGWADDFALHIVKKAATGGDVEAGMTSLATGSGVAAGQFFLAIMISATIIGASLVQVVLLLIRSAMLILLAGTFPLAAAATNTEVGKAWFRKFCGWSLAFIAYKPAAALIYAAAMKLNQAAMLPGDNQLVRAMTGIMMLMLAVFALPALLRFAVPLTAAVAGGSAAMGSSVADPGGLATGAINVGRARAGGGAGGGAAAGGGGASGARTVGAASAGLGAAAGALTAARKAGGAVAGAASHSAGESGGGGSTPSSFGPSGSGRGGAGGGRASGGGGGSRGGGSASGGGGSRSGRGGGGGSFGGPSGGGPSGASGGARSNASGGRAYATSGTGSTEYDGPAGSW